MTNQPHIIYILSDEHYGGAMSHMGDPNVRTPNMDQLAAEGISFERAYANCPICTPSRGTIFSGRHAHAGPVQYFFDVFKPTSPSTATLLREAGYHTAYFGKWHCGVVRDQIPPAVRESPEEYPSRWNMRTPEYHRGGFQDWYGFEINNAPFQGFYYHEHEVNPRKFGKYQTDALTDMAIDYLKQYDGDKPLFLVLSVEPPHFPLDAPDEYLRFDPDTLEMPPNFVDSPEMRELVSIYYAMVENLDANIGRLMQSVGTLPNFQNDTLTVYFSDHGDYMGSHGAINRKENPHEKSVRIPAIFHFPERIQAQELSNELFSLVDLLPTTLGFLGLDIPNYIQGLDFSPVLRNEPFQGPDKVLIEMSGNPRWNLDFLDWRGLVTAQWKYAFYETGHELLYNLETDPHEMDNLARSDVNTCNTMRQQLLDLLAKTREPYFDVLIEHGVQVDGPVLDVGVAHSGRLSPTWTDMIQRA